MVRAGVDNKKIVGAVEIILKELKKICRSPVKRDELTRAKDYFLGQILLGLEDTLDHMLWMGESVMILDRVRSLKEMIKGVNQVQLADIQRIANEILKEKHFNLALVGPLTGAQEKEIKLLF